MRKLCLIFFAIVVFIAAASPVLAARGILLENLCDDKQLECITIARGETWENLFPDEKMRNLVMRINRMNTLLYKGMILAVPKDFTQDDLLAYSPFPQERESNGQKTILYDPNINAWAAYDAEGILRRWGAASSGKAWCTDINDECLTPSGTYTIYTKQGSQCFSKKFPLDKGGAPMPYCMFFKGGYALHGSQEVPGYNASHGCVRLFTEDAKWLNQTFITLPTKKDRGTRVIVSQYHYLPRTDKKKSVPNIKGSSEEEFGYLFY